MHPAGWITVAISLLGGLSGIAAVFKAWSDNRKSRGDLSAILSSTAQNWVEYIDGKFNQVTSELNEHKTDQARKDAARSILHDVHRAWDVEIRDRLQEITGEPISDPPPLDIPRHI